jgi:RimJ/RimL family protein N-acetyltransferase
VLFTLPSGEQVAFRDIRPDDKGRLAVGLRRLSPESRRRRFLVAKPHLSAAELRYLTEVDGVDHVAIVAALAEDPDAFIGVARYVRLPGDPATAEAAIVVGDRWQGQGLGRAMGRRLADEARRAGVERFTATLLGDNVAAHRLFASLAARLQSDLAGGVEELVADLVAA